jgi:tetratricopeptide (TPR) repeat protein
MAFVGDVVQLFSRAHLRTRRAPRRPSADEWYQHGCELERAEPEQARRAYARALAAEPSHEHAHLNLGRLLHEAGQLGAAEGHYRLAVLCGNRTLGWYNLGVVLEDTGRLAEARNAYRRVLALAPELADAHYNIAGVLERLGDPMGALRHLSAYRRLRRKAG